MNSRDALIDLKVAVRLESTMQARELLARTARACEAFFVGIGSSPLVTTGLLRQALAVFETVRAEALQAAEARHVAEGLRDLDNAVDAFRGMIETFEGIARNEAAASLEDGEGGV